MAFRTTIQQLFLIVVASCLVTSDAVAQSAGNWVGTWAAAPAAQTEHGDIPPDGLTIRQIVHVSQGGSAIRIKFTNELGTDSLRIGRAVVSLDTGSNTSPVSVYPISFGGRSSVAIPEGGIAVSDPIGTKVPSSSGLAISIYLPSQAIHVWTRHALSMQTNYEAPGNQSAQPNLISSKPITSYYFLKAVDVNCATKCSAIVAFGDSITDGLHSTIDANRRWPNVLASRLAENISTQSISVLNEGVSGNRVLHDGTGPNALARFDRDVLAQSGVKYVIILEGINDIGRATRAKDPVDSVTIEDLSWGLTQLVTRAHQFGIKVYGATLTPAAHGSVAGEALRSGLNQWIRTSGVFDAVIDFDQAIRDPQAPIRMVTEYDSGDSLHPSDAGYKKMGESIDLKLFQETTQR